MARTIHTNSRPVAPAIGYTGTSPRPKVAHVPARRASADALARLIHDHHLRTAIAIAHAIAAESDQDVQWAIDRLDFDRGRTRHDRERRADARHRLVLELRHRGVSPRDPESASTYRPRIPA